MPQKSAPELFAVVHYLHRLSTEGKRGAKMALESCPKCHFIMLEGVLMTIEEHGQNGTIYVSDLAAAVKQPLPAVSRALRQLEQDGLIERDFSGILGAKGGAAGTRQPAAQKRWNTEHGKSRTAQGRASAPPCWATAVCGSPPHRREPLTSPGPKRC